MSLFSAFRSPARCGTVVLATVVLASALASSPIPATAAQGGVFRPFLGDWQGAGTIASNDGRKERITCRATYRGGEDETLTQSVVCASDAFRVNIESSMTANGGELQGQWQETTRNVQGQLSGQVSRGDIEGSASGPGFTVQISIRSSGRQQAVHIQPSAGDIQSVDISLSKRK